MASETQTPESNFLEGLINSRNRDLSLFLPIILGFTNRSHGSDQETPEPRDRIILINPFTQGMVVMEGVSSRLDYLFQDLQTKAGQPPASRASIEAMPSVEITDDDGECAICLEEWGIGELAKEMPCKHRFHGDCIERWLKLHGSCPVCRYSMPVDDEVNKKNGDGDDDDDDDDDGVRRRRRNREIWVSFSFNGDRGRRGDLNQTATSDSDDSSSHSNTDPETQT